MEPLLRPWFAHVDGLLPDRVQSPANPRDPWPRWRGQLYGGDGGNGIGKSRVVVERMYIDVFPQLLESEQRQLREAFELFALAIQIDSHAFLNAVARGLPWLPPLWTYEPYARGQLIQLRLPGDPRRIDEESFQTFLDDLTDATSSDDFKTTKQKLLALGGLKQDVPVHFF